LRPVIRERRLVGARRYKLARRTAEQELDEAAAKLRLTGLRIARPSGGGLRLSLHCCSPIGPLVRREGAGKELERVGQGVRSRAEYRRNLDCLVNFAPRIFGDRLIWTLFIKLEFILSK
jgi:hypothetical protein